MTELHPTTSREGDAFLHNDPYLGNTHTADHAILVPVFVDGEHVFTACAKAHQADCGNSLPTTYMPCARDVYDEGALNFPCVRVQRDYEDIEDIIRMCRRRIRVPEQWYGDYLAALGAARIGERRLKELCAQYGLETIRAFVAEWFDYSERRMAQAITAAARAARSTAARRTTRTRACPTGSRSRSTVQIDAEEGRDRGRPARQPRQLRRAGSTSRAPARRTTSIIGRLQLARPGRPAQRRQLPADRRCYLREGCIAGIPRFPHSCSMATTNVADRLVCITQAAFAELGDGFGLAEGGDRAWAPLLGRLRARDARLGDAPYVNQLFIGNDGGPGSPDGRRLADLRAARLRRR